MEKTERKERRGRRRKQILDELSEMRRRWKLEQEAIDRSLWRSGCGRCNLPSWDRQCERTNVIVFTVR